MHFPAYLYVTRVLEGGVAGGRASQLADRATEASLGAGDQEEYGGEEEKRHRHRCVGNSARGDVPKYICTTWVKNIRIAPNLDFI